MPRGVNLLGVWADSSAKRRLGVSPEMGVRDHDNAAPRSSHDYRDLPGKGEASVCDRGAGKRNTLVCVEVSVPSWEVSKRLSGCQSGMPALLN